MVVQPGLCRTRSETPKTGFLRTRLKCHAQPNCDCGSLLPVFGVRVSVTVHLLCVRIIFCSVWVAEWPTFGKELLTLLTICSLCSLTICNFSY